MDNFGLDRTGTWSDRSVQTDWTETRPDRRFGLGLGLGPISMIQMSVRSYISPGPSVWSRSRSKRFGLIGRTRTGPIYCSMTERLNGTFKALYHATYQYLNWTDIEVAMHQTYNRQEFPSLFYSLLVLPLSQ